MSERTLRDAALRIVTSSDLADKLRPPARDLTDDARDVDAVPIAPTRPPHLAIRPAHEARVPPLAGLADPAQRARIVHAHANHELQAAELFAWALLAYPDAPAEFRRGLASILADEQRHAALYVEQLAPHDMVFGDLPVSGYFWNKVTTLTTPARFVCAMCLTFEAANLDHAEAGAEAARERHDDGLARALALVHRDEVRHVAFGWRWLEVFKRDDETMWDAYVARTQWPLRPALARGERFDADARRRAGFDEAFIARVEAADRAAR